MFTKEQTRKYFQNLKCEVLTSKEDNKKAIIKFESHKNNNSLSDYLKKYAWEADLDGETRIYLVKDARDQVILFFSLKCGLLISSNQYDKLDEISSNSLIYWLTHCKTTINKQ